MKNGEKGKLPSIKRRGKKRRSKKADKMSKLESSVDEQTPLFNNLSDNEDTFRSIYKDSSDVIFRPFYIGEQVKAILIYIEGLSNIEEIDDSVLSPLIKSSMGENYFIDTLKIGRASCRERVYISVLIVDST